MMRASATSDPLSTPVRLCCSCQQWMRDELKTFLAAVGEGHKMVYGVFYIKDYTAFSFYNAFLSFEL